MFPGIPGRRVAHAEHADQPVDPVTAVVHDRTVRFALDAVAAGRHGKQTAMDQTHVSGMERKPREGPVRRGNERIDLAPVERESVHRSVVAVVARPDDRELAPGGHEEKAAVGLPSHRVGAGQG